MELLTDSLLFQKFCDCSLTHAEWTHQSHLRIGYLHVIKYDFITAVNHIRSRINNLNRVHEVPEALDRGYHETITQAFMHLIKAASLQKNYAHSIEFYDDHPELHHKKCLLEYYSREHIMTKEAKESFVLPDLKDLPTGAN